MPSFPSSSQMHMSPQTGDVISGKYRVVRMLGKGGMGEVYEAVHTATARRVALKLLSSVSQGDTEHEFKERQARFAREAMVIGQIRSEHVVEIYDAGITGDHGQPYMAMEYLTGEDLSGAISRVGPLPYLTVIKLAVQAARGLVRAHEQQIVHRDIKPANLFLAREGQKLTLKILDFGVARMSNAPQGVDLTQDLTRTGSVIGSPAYMSPEQIRGLKEIDGRADLWSLCASLYKLLCGRTPHVKGDAGIGDLLIAICCSSADPVRRHAPWVPPAVGAAVHRGLALNAQERYGNAQAMLDTFLQLLPDGNDVLTEADIRPLREDEREGSTAPDIMFDSGSSRVVDGSPNSAETSAAGTINGRSMSIYAPVPPKRRARTMVTVIASAVVAAVLGTGLALRTNLRVTPVTEANNPGSAAASPGGSGTAASTAEPLATSAVPAAEKQFTVWVKLPSGVDKVTIDGDKATADNGRVSITARGDSLLTLDLFRGKDRNKCQVKIKSDGTAYPDECEWAKAAGGGGFSGSGGAPPKKGGDIGPPPTPPKQTGLAKTFD